MKEDQIARGTEGPRDTKGQWEIARTRKQDSKYNVMEEQRRRKRGDRDRGRGREHRARAKTLMGEL